MRAPFTPESEGLTPTGLSLRIGRWDVSNVETMEGMFKGFCRHFRYKMDAESDPLDDNNNYWGVENWDVSSVTSMKEMFSLEGTTWNCFSLGMLPIAPNVAKWNVGQVTTVEKMFWKNNWISIRTDEIANNPYGFWYYRDPRKMPGRKEGGDETDPATMWYEDDDQDAATPTAGNQNQDVGYIRFRQYKTNGKVFDDNSLKNYYYQTGRKVCCYPPGKINNFCGGSDTHYAERTDAGNGGNCPTQGIAGQGYITRPSYWVQRFDVSKWDTSKLVETA